MSQDQHHKKKRHLVIDDEEDDEPMAPPPSRQPEKMIYNLIDIQKEEQQPEKHDQHAVNANKSKEANGNNNKPAQNTQPVKNNVESVNSKTMEKVVRKDQERVQNAMSKIEAESDDHASDKDLFLPDDSNTEGIRRIT